jgi:lactate permease
MEINFVSWLLTALPIILFLILMLVFKWSGSRSAAFVWIVTILIAWKFFGADLNLFEYTYVKSFFISLDILLIILTALFFYRITEKAGTSQKIGQVISQFTNNRGLQAIFLGWLFPSFLQGVGGFGVPVAIASPLLFSIGFSPEQSVIMASVGHAWAITFGSMANAFQSLIATTNLPGTLLAPSCALCLGIVSIFCGLLVTFIADGIRGVKVNFFYTLFFSCILAVGQYILATNGLWIIAVIVPSLLALGIGFLINRLFTTRKQKLFSVDRTNKKNNKIHEPTLSLSLLPYGILVFLTLTINLIPTINNFLSQTKIFVEFPQIISTLGDITPAGPGRIIAIFSHPGTTILITALISFLIFYKFNLLKGIDFKIILKQTIKGSIQTSLVLFMMVEIAVIMSHTRMTDILAQGLSQIFDKNLYAFISPLIGAVGSFITGTNTNSNVLFANVQMRIADLLGLNIFLFLAAQTAGGAIGSILSPAKVFLGCSTVDLVGKERQVMIKLLVYVLILLFIIGLITLLYQI